MNFDIRWIDSGHEPKCAPNPKFPNGVDVDASEGAKRICKTNLPYPAKRIGTYMIECKICGKRVAITTAGRPDDPRSITVSCGIKSAAQ